ncbi:hypothetical protein M0P98_03210 [bacterium]|nr:hypothetical protein [bacterium]
MKKTVIFGAGQIGRGFIGDICGTSEYKLVFVDVAQPVITLLNDRQEYPIWLLSDKKIEKKISNLKGIHFSSESEIVEEIASVNLAFTAVGANNLSFLAPLIAKGVKRRIEKGVESFLNIVICENLLGSADILRESIEKHLSCAEKNYIKTYVGFVETVVSRMVAPLPDSLREKEPLLVTVEPYNILPVAKKSFKGQVPAVKGFYPVEDIVPYEELKLFGHNLAHATLAYVGYLAGYEFIWECMGDIRLYKLLERVVEETKVAIIKKHSLNKKEVEDYISDLFVRFKNKALNDTVVRVGRDPLRKIGANDRLAGAIKVCLNEGVFPENISFVMATCLCYNYGNDESATKLQGLLEDKGIDYVLRNISCLNDERVICEVKEKYIEIKNRKLDYFDKFC